MSKLIATIIERNELALLIENASSGSMAARLIDALNEVPYYVLDNFDSQLLNSVLVTKLCSGRFLIRFKYNRKFAAARKFAFMEEGNAEALAEELGVDLLEDDNIANT